MIQFDLMNPTVLILQLSMQEQVAVSGLLQNLVIDLEPMFIIRNLLMIRTVASTVLA